jgi:hypothetical protein
MCTVRVTIKLHEAHKVLNLSHVNAHDTARLVLVDSGAGGTVISDVSRFSVINPPVQDVSIIGLLITNYSAINTKLQQITAF